MVSAGVRVSTETHNPDVEVHNPEIKAVFDKIGFGVMVSGCPLPS